MTASTQAWYVYPPGYGVGGTGAIVPPSGSLHPEDPPAWLWGQGTPAAIAPFTLVHKGSLYSQVNATDDDPHLWVKVDEGGDTGDWVLQGSTGIVSVLGVEIDISAADSEQVIFHAVTASEIIECGMIYNEATGTSGAAEGDVTIGTTTGGAEIVAAVSYAISQATGTYVAFSLVSGVLAAGTSVFVSHDIAASAGGTVRVLMKIRVEA